MNSALASPKADKEIVKLLKEAIYAPRLEHQSHLYSLPSRFKCPLCGRHEYQGKYEDGVFLPKKLELPASIIPNRRIAICHFCRQRVIRFSQNTPLEKVNNSEKKSKDPNPFSATTEIRESNVIKNVPEGRKVTRGLVHEISKRGTPITLPITTSREQKELLSQNKDTSSGNSAKTTAGKSTKTPANEYQISTRAKHEARHEESNEESTTNTSKNLVNSRELISMTPEKRKKRKKSVFARATVSSFLARKLANKKRVKTNEYETGDNKAEKDEDDRNEDDQNENSHENQTENQLQNGDTQISDQNQDQNHDQEADDMSDNYTSANSALSDDSSVDSNNEHPAEMEIDSTSSNQDAQQAIPKENNRNGISNENGITEASEASSSPTDNNEIASDQNDSNDADSRTEDLPQNPKKRKRTNHNETETIYQNSERTPAEPMDEAQNEYVKENLKELLSNKKTHINPILRDTPPAGYASFILGAHEISMEPTKLGPNPISPPSWITPEYVKSITDSMLLQTANLDLNQDMLKWLVPWVIQTPCKKSKLNKCPGAYMFKSFVKTDKDVQPLRIACTDCGDQDVIFVQKNPSKPAQKHQN